MQVFGLWEEAEVPLREPPQKQGGGLNTNRAALFQLGACDPLAPPPPCRRRPYRSDGRLPSVRFCAITPAIAALL